MSSVDDLHALARIRTEAIRLFGERGIRATTVRQIAEAAGVSPALVMHHFGSKDGLRAACDDWLLVRISRDKEVAVTGQLDEDTLQDGLADLRPFMGYIAASLSEGGPSADRLFDHLCDVTDATYDAGVAAGTMHEPTDRAAAVATLVAYTAGASLLGRHIARRLGGSELLDSGVYERYSLASLELFTRGMFVDEGFLDGVADAITHHRDAAPSVDPTSDPDPPAGR